MRPEVQAAGHRNGGRSGSEGASEVFYVFLMPAAAGRAVVGRHAEVRLPADDDEVLEVRLEGEHLGVRLQGAHQPAVVLVGRRVPGVRVVEEDDELLGEKQGLVVVQELGVEGARGRAEEKVVSQEQVVRVEVYADDLGRMLALQVFEEPVEVLWVLHLPLDWQLGFGLDQLEPLEVSLAFGVRVFSIIHAIILT